MKKKVLKIIALVIAIALIVGIAWLANSLNGNPISKMLAEKAADNYLEEHYSETDYYIEKLGFSFKSICYYAHVRSETSMDTQFTLYIDMVGNVYFDTYDDVLRGSITARRWNRNIGISPIRYLIIPRFLTPLTLATERWKSIHRKHWMTRR